MASKDTSRRQRLSANIKSAIATAAVVGTLGGWVAFGSQQTATTDASTAAAISNDSAAESTSNSSAAQSSTSSSTSSQTTTQPRVVTRTRSSG